MKPLSKRTHPPPKSRNLWGGLVVEKPGGMERDDERLGAESRRAAEQMRKNAKPPGGLLK